MKKQQRHGLRNTSEYSIWCGIKYRCLNKNSPSFKYYGGRGIKICKKWENSFLDFINDMGPRPSKSHTIERIDNDKGYSPENCRWETISNQQRNKRVSLIKGSKKSKGVFKSGNKWKSSIEINNRSFYLGTFDTEKEASNYYEKVRVALTGGPSANDVFNFIVKAIISFDKDNKAHDIVNHLKKIKPTILKGSSE